MYFGFKELWSKLESSFGSLVPTITMTNVDVDKLKQTTESINNKTNEKLALTNTIIKHLSLFTSVKAEENSDQIPNSWQNMIIKGPSTYSSMRKTFDDVLITCQKDSQKLTKKFNDDDWNLKLEVVKFGDSNSLKLNTLGQMHTSGIFSLFFQTGDENNIGLKIKAHESVSLKTGISKKSEVYKNSLWSSVTFENPAAVLDAKVEVFDHSISNGVNMEASGMFGHNVGKFGVLAGFNVALNSSNFNWKEMCQAVSLGIVAPTMGTVLTIQPNAELCTIDGCYKTDLFQLVIRLKGNYKTRSWCVREQEVGLKYEHSENMAYGIKSDFSGNITVGTWLNMPLCKLALLAKIGNIGSIENIGISIEV